MAEYISYKRLLVSKGKKPKVATPSISAPLVTPSASPTVISQVLPLPFRLLLMTIKLKVMFIQFWLPC